MTDVEIIKTVCRKSRYSSYELGDRLILDCPRCSGSFSAWYRFSAGVFKCEECKFSGNMLALVQKMKKLNFEQTVFYLRNLTKQSNEPFEITAIRGLDYIES